MKILVVSLLRLGDVVLASPIIEGLRNKYPDCEIHILINKQFRSIAPLLPEHQKMHLFDRHRLQESLVEPELPLLEPYDRMAQLVDKLNSEKFDMILNLTHNRLSGWITGMLECPDVRGLSLDLQGRPQFGSSWFKFLNNYMGSGGRESFHFSDIYSFACGLEGRTRSLSLRETNHGIQQAHELIGQKEPIIAIQPLTSDTKKNWGLEHWSEAIQLFSSTYGNQQFDFCILGSPGEKPKVHQLVEDLNSKGIAAFPGVCDLETLYSVLCRSKMLVTGDTSVKHMAAAAGVKTIELSLGSSDYRKTGSYQEGSLIIQSNESCAPCPHSGDCFQSDHLCAQKISPAVVSMTMKTYLQDDWNQLRTVAKEFRDEVEIFRTLFTQTGFWVAHPVEEGFGLCVLNQWLDKVAWKFLLERNHLNPLGPYGSEGVDLLQSFRAVFSEQEIIERKIQVSQLENQIERRDQQINHLLAALTTTVRRFSDKAEVDDFVTKLEVFYEQADEDPALPHVVSALSKNSDQPSTSQFPQLRKIQCSLNEMYQRNLIKLKIIRSLKHQVAEL